MSAFAEQTPEGWRILEPLDFDDELIDAAVRAYREIADRDPQKMGKSKACYSQMYQLTSLYRRFSR